MEHNNDYIATEMLAEIKQNGKRWFRVAMAILAAWVLTIGGFLWYLDQYDFSGSSTTSYSTVKDANGLYAIIDSEGNVIASDIPDDQLEEYLNGIGAKNDNSNQNNN